MAAQPATRVEERRPVGRGHLPEPLGPRALRVGLRTTLLAPLGAAASAALVADDGPGLGALLPVFLAIVAMGAVVAFLPWDRLQGTALGRRILHAWAVLNVVLITIAGWSTGDMDAALPLGYAVTIVFFAVLLSPRAQLVYLAFLLACYGALLVSSTFEPLPFLMLGVLGLLASFLSRELRRRIAAHDRARVESERRWAVVGSVSSVARDMSAAEPRRVLQGIVEAIVTLGYETAAIHLPGAAPDLRVVLPEGTDADPTRGIRTLPESIRTRVLDEGRDAIVKLKDVDRTSARGLRSSGIGTVAATPIVAGERPEGVLLVASSSPEGIGAKELEAFAMLAATAAIALGNARRADEQREVADRLAEADRLRADLTAQLSTEVRKPLAAVTETTRALRETFGNEARHRLLQRLATSATALDVTLGGSLDLALLEAGGVELRAQEFDVGELVSRVLTRLAGLFEGRELRATLPPGLTVEADPALVEQAVEHVVATAATSSAPGRAVEVSVSRAGAETIVKVAGEAVIPADQLARIAQPSGDRKAAGPWIRLALAAKILELHGSELQIRSEPKQGTRVWFQLPGDPAALAATGGHRAAAAAEGGSPVQLSFDDALLPAVAAEAAAFEPPPVEIEEEERRSTPLAAAALAATAASSLVVTGIVPELLRRPQIPAVTSTEEERPRKDRDRQGDRSDRERSEDGASTGGTTDGSGQSTSGSTDDTPTGDTSTGGATDGGTDGGTGDGGTGGGGSGDGGTGDGGSGDGGSGDGGSEDPPPPDLDGSPGNSDEAPGHNKDEPSASPSPSPTP